MNLPKVLILNQPFNNNTGGGITLTNLFAGWDKNKLAIACSGKLLEGNIDTSICSNYYQLGHKEDKWIFPFKYLKRKYYSGRIMFTNDKIQNLSTSKSKLRVKIILNFLFPVLNFFGLSHFISKIILSVDFCEWLTSLNPDIIYAQATDRNTLLFCTKVSDYLGKPMVFHMMDDWPSAVEGLFKKYWRKKIDKEIRTLLSKSALLMSISDYMAEEYKRRYEKDFVTFHNPIDITFWGKYQKINYELSKEPKILYAGRVGLGIDASLLKVAHAVTTVNKRQNRNIKFILQTQDKPSWVSKFKCVVHQPFSSYGELPRIFGEADLLLLPYDFSKLSIRFIRYSMPTKASEYMVCGTPIVLFAPPDTAIVKYLQKFKCARIITINNINVLVESLNELLEDKTERQNIGLNAIKVSERNHDAEIVTKEFQKKISSLVIKDCDKF